MPVASGSTASHAYAADGSSVVTLIVTDNAGATASTTRTVAVTAPSALPVARFPAPAVSGRAITVDGSASSATTIRCTDHTRTSRS